MCAMLTRLAVVLLAMLAAAPARTAPPERFSVLPQPAETGFEQATTARAFSFPADHGPHRTFRQEWWYLTGNLDDAHGERFGFELTFFRVALAPPAALPAGASAWRSRELYLAHFAVSDVARKHFMSAQKLERGALTLAGAQGAPLSVWVDDWALTEREGAWHLHAAQGDYAIDFTLVPAAEPVLNGAHGLSRKAEEASAASYYYSIPRLSVHGELRRGNAAHQVTGLAWLDREWGSGALGANELGWDWFALQLNDGAALMFYQLRDRDGRPDPHSAGTWISADGQAQSLSNSDVAVEVTASWRNAQGTRYPAAWRLKSTARGLDLTLHPVLADQELKTTPRYWEGAVDVQGVTAGRAVHGRGYVELVGYAQER
jgi:predicted secreted hydrolase